MRKKTITGAQVQRLVELGRRMIKGKNGAPRKIGRKKAFKLNKCGPKQGFFAPTRGAFGLVCLDCIYENHSAWDCLTK